MEEKTLKVDVSGKVKLPLALEFYSVALVGVERF